jgi:tetratricopeptide (TPR) repeat protein
MVRSPIFILLLLFSIISCQEGTETISSSLEKNDTANSVLAKKLSGLGDTYYMDKKFDKAFYHYMKSKDLFEVEKNDAFAAYNLIQLARIQQTFGDYNDSEETLTEALPFIKNNIEYQIAANNLFGISSKELKNYEDAIFFYNKILKTVNDPLLRVTPVNNIATVYIEQEKYREAVAFLEPISKSTVLDTLPHKKAIIIDNLGFAYYKDNAIPKGLALMNQGLAIRKKINDSYGSIESHLHLADFYQNRDHQKSKENALQAYKVATKYQSIDERLEALEFLMSYNMKKGVNSYAAMFVNLNDSIKTVRNNAKNQFAKIKYDSREATLENIKYKGQRAETLLQLETQKNQKYLLSFGLVVLLGGIGFLIHYFRNKSKRELLVASYKTEIRISKQLHDELANDVFYAMTFAETQDLLNPIKKETLLDNLDKIYVRTRDFSKENSTIETGESFEHNLKQMLSNYKCDSVEVIIKNGKSIDWSKIENEKKIALQRVLQELMVNMKKYSQANFVIIGFDSDQNNVIIDYSDNGIGFSEKLILKNGLQNAENRIKAVKGILTFDSQINKGFKAKILLPK